MKTLSGTVGVLVLTVIAIATVVSCHERRPAVDRDILVAIGTPNLNTDPVEYVDVDKGRLDAALKSLKENGGGKCYIAFLSDDGKTLTKPYEPCTDEGIMQDSITNSQNAKNRPAGVAVANDPNITYRVLGKSGDVKAVVDSFKE
jgi:hypothetical protein